MGKNTMIELATIAQAVAVLSTCWVIVSGIGAWKREFIGKRKIELAEQVLAKFFEIRDAIAFIRNPFGGLSEGTTRERGKGETQAQSELLDRGYVVVERYSKKETAFAEFNILKYRFMASFGTNTEEIFTDTNRVLNSIFVSARRLATHHWQRQGRVSMEQSEVEKHLAEMERHEGVFWDIGNEVDEIRQQINAIQAKLEAAVKPCFQEPAASYIWLTRKWF
ncbi:hypothetical protein LP417_32250 [Polaromonas sp. P1-6]|nr:hypothetical protein LP417_32250 [Polaromonas sp. P1-6]